MNGVGERGAQATPPGFVPASPGAYGPGDCESDKSTEVADVSAMREVAAVSLTPGTLLGERYRLLKLLGQGGMGQAWEAEHIVIRKRVAVKVLGGSMMGPDPQESAERLLREAQAAAQIKHPNIVDITDFGHTRDGQPFYVMELLEGATLKDLIQVDGALPWPRARALLTQMCDALAKAHAHGVIHRDLKPDNIFVVNDGPQRDVVKIIDFGIAKLTTLDPQAKAFTRTGMVYGTPSFMSPEQSEGEKIDARTDVYALGCVAYQMLTGTLPFAGETPTEVIYKQLFEEPMSMAVAAPHAVVSPDVEAVVLKAMRKSRDLRFQSMHEMAEAVRAAGQGGPPLAVPVETIRKPPRGYNPNFAPSPAGVQTGTVASLPPASAQNESSIGVGLAIACFGGLVMLGLLAYLGFQRFGGQEGGDEDLPASEALDLVEPDAAAGVPAEPGEPQAPAEEQQGEADGAEGAEAADAEDSPGGPEDSAGAAGGGQGGTTRGGGSKPGPKPAAAPSQPQPAPEPTPTPTPLPEPEPAPTPQIPQAPEPKPEPAPEPKEPEAKGVHDSDLVNPWDK